MSVFDLKRSVAELKSANEGMSKSVLMQISSTRDVTLENFPNGLQHFRQELGGNQWFVPSLSYFRARIRLTQVRTDGQPLQPILQTADLAPNMGLVSDIFQSIEVRLGGNTLQRIGERMPIV